RNTHIYFVYIQVRVRFQALGNCLLYRTDTLVYVHHYTMTHPCRIHTPESQNLQLTELVLPACYRSHLGGTNVQSYNDGLLFTHTANVYYFIIGRRIYTSVFFLLVLPLFSLPALQAFVFSAALLLF